MKYPFISKILQCSSLFTGHGLSRLLQLQISLKRSNKIIKIGKNVGFAPILVIPKGEMW